jgi:hypothetical protein
MPESDLTNHGNRTHGHSRSLTYVSLAQLIQRCTNPNNPSFTKYGGRGITVCQRWRNSFEAFLEDMGERPSNKHSIDRIHNDRGYDPGNCRWATKVEQCRNKSDNRLITVDGETHCLSEWDEIKGFPRGRIADRLQRGWAEEEAVRTPLRRTNLKGR